MKTLQRIIHLLQRIKTESIKLPQRWYTFGAKVALISFWDGLIPPGKSQKYIAIIEEYVDTFLGNLVEQYKKEPEIVPKGKYYKKIPVWCCWWQGEDNMPELVRMCHDRLKQVIPNDKAELHLITIDNYLSYVDIPCHIRKKFDQGVITMTAMSDVLRFQLLEKYGGYWVDATVFFTGNIPSEYFSGKFYCQRMAEDYENNKREACRGNWCGFSMAGESGSIIFRFMNDAFAEWWGKYDCLIDYVLIDYLLLSGYKFVPQITNVINGVPDNNQDIFNMYRVLNQPYSKELYAELTQKNVMHKLTYKMELKKNTDAGELTLYGYLLKMVYGDREKYDSARIS